MKLIIQIPCLNESKTLPATLSDLPTAVDGFDEVETLVIDDGSVDDTAGVARSLGVDHVLVMNGNQGLARAFMAGLEYCVLHGADVIVNTDADNQYDGSFVRYLVQPLACGTADIAIGVRPIATIDHFSPIKKTLQHCGSFVVRSLSGADVQDAPCGFRAMTRETALRLNVFGDFSYTLETIIQSGQSNLRIANIPIRVNGPTRPSRLFRSNLHYVARSVMTITSAYVVYRPVRFFFLLALLLWAPGVALGFRFLALFFAGSGSGHVQSLIACAILVLGSFFMGAIGTLAHLQSINRKLLQDIRYYHLDRKSRPPEGESPDGVVRASSPSTFVH